MNVFYAPSVSAGQVILGPTESGHCIRVMRHRSGDRVRIVDGKGGSYEGEIVDADPKACSIHILERHVVQVPMSYALHICIAPTKSNDRFEWFLEKATEIGVTSITPVVCQRSERRKIRTDRMVKILIAAMKQSGRTNLPDLLDAVKFDQLMERPFSGTGFIAYCSRDNKQDIRQVEFMHETTVLIGPEGDFTEGEVALAMNKGYLPLSMGDATFRTETAGIMACSAAFYQMK